MTSPQLTWIPVRFGFNASGAAADCGLRRNRDFTMTKGKHEKPVGAMGYYPTRGFFELNPDMTATCLRRGLLSDLPAHPFIAPRLSLPN
jgi:hypothetical protein